MEENWMGERIRKERQDQEQVWRETSEGQRAREMNQNMKLPGRLEHL